MFSQAAGPFRSFAPGFADDAVPAEQFGAYGVVEDGTGQVLTVKAANGRFYLPGGRIEAGEGPGEALLREIAEECGWSATLLAPLRSGSQLIMGGTVLLRASHWRVRLVARLAGEAEHRMVWVEPHEALDNLHRDCDRAALRILERADQGAA